MEIRSVILIPFVSIRKLFIVVVLPTPLLKLATVMIMIAGICQLANQPIIQLAGNLLTQLAKSKLINTLELSGDNRYPYGVAERVVASGFRAG